jgi:intein/homing endonuclease
MWGLNESRLSGMWDWSTLKENIIKHGICNSLFTAQMPVACQTSDTRIITENGILSFKDICEMNNINVNDIEKEKRGGIWFNFEKPINVKTMDGFHSSNKIYYNGHAEIFKIEMEDGTVFQCSEEHMFLVNRNNQQLWVKVKDMIDGDDIVNIIE